jgi:hypothetical protein
MLSLTNFSQLDYQENETKIPSKCIDSFEFGVFKSFSKICLSSEIIILVMVRNMVVIIMEKEKMVIVEN